MLKEIKNENQEFEVEVLRPLAASRAKCHRTTEQENIQQMTIPQFKIFNAGKNFSRPQILVAGPISRPTDQPADNPTDRMFQSASAGFLILHDVVMGSKFYFENWKESGREEGSERD